MVQLWKPAAQRNLRNQWSKLNSLRHDWRSAASVGRSHATALANSYLSQKYMDGMEFGVLSDMPNIRMKASYKLLRQQELYRCKLLSSYKEMVGVLTHMVKISKSMRCYFEGTSNSPLARFSFSIASFEELALEIVRMFISELNYEETHEPILPCLKNRSSTTSNVEFKREKDNNVLQVYLTTWLAEVNIDKCRVDEIFGIVGGEMHVNFLETFGL